MSDSGVEFWEPVLARIRYTMRDEGLSYRDVAGMAGIAPSTVGRIVNSQDVRISSLIKVSRALGVEWSLEAKGEKNESLSVADPRYQEG